MIEVDEARLFHIVASEIISKNPHHAATYLGKIADESDKKVFQRLIATATAEDDPERALKLLGEIGNQGIHSYPTVFKAWMRKNPSAAIAAAAKLTNQRARDTVQKTISSFLASEDPDQAWSYALNLKGSEQMNLTKNVIAQVAGRDPQKALTFLKDVPEGQRRNDALTSVFRGWLGKNSDEAQNWLQSLPTSEQSEVLGQSIYYLPPGDIEKTVALLEQLPPNSRTPSVYSNVMTKWADTDPQAAQEWMKQLPPGQARQSALEALLRSSAKKDPSLAASLLEGESINSRNSYEISEIASSWALADPDTAFSWLDSLEVAGSTREQLISNTISQLADKDPSKAASYTLSIEDTEVRKGAIQSLVGKWGLQDLAATKTWITTHLEKSEQAEANSYLISRLSSSDPTKALELLAEASQSLTPEEVKKQFERSRKSISISWAHKDPNAAAAWAQAQPDDEERHQLVANVVDGWAEFDTTGAANFVLTLNEGKERDSAIKSLVSELGRWDPESAFLWAESTTDLKARERVVSSTIRTWTRSDPDAAREALLKANIPEGVRSKLLRRFD